MDTVNYVSYAIDTQDLQREKMVRTLKLGLIKYLIKSNLADEINISFTKSKVETNQKDEWNYWLFNFSLNSNFNGQANQDALWLQGSVNANRTTENSKVNFNTYSTYSQNKYVYDNGTEQTNILSLSRAQGLNSYYVNSIDNHWSWGFWAGINTSTYSNLKYSLFAAPGIEYNIFPYTVSNERQFMIDYQIKSIYNNYIQETIFLKNDDYLWCNYVSLSFSLIKPWGNINIHCNGASFLNDLNFYQLGISSNFSVELFRGVSVNFYGGYSKIQDQFSLPISGESLEDVLTQAKQIPTSYNYWGGLGVSYSFGSIYNNFVNSRFDGV